MRKYRLKHRLHNETTYRNTFPPKGASFIFNRYADLKKRLGEDYDFIVEVHHD